MKKIFALLPLAAMFAAGCTVNEPAENITVNAPTFYASIEGQDADETKTFVDDKLIMRWTKDDEISIFAGSTLNQRYKYDGETGANSGTFSPVTTQSGFVVADPLNANYAVYPYASATEMDASGKITLTLPSAQSYVENTFGPGANTMVAVTESKSDMLLQFKNLCGYLVVKLYGSGTVKSVTIEGNNAEKLAGKATVTATFGTAPSLTMSEDADTTITVDCGEGVELGPTAETATEFWFCIPPVTFSKGFTVTAQGTAGTFSKSTTGSRTIERNVRVSMPAIEFVPEGPVVPEMVDLGLPSGIKWASFNLGATKPEEYGRYYQWAGLEDVTDTSIYLDVDNCPYHTGTDSFSCWEKYFTSQEKSIWFYDNCTDNKTVLDPEDDIAQTKLGGKWRMPTREEFNELIENCTSERMLLNGVNGRIFTSKKNGNSIFMPTAGYRSYDFLYDAGTRGYYGSSSLDADSPNQMFGFNFSSDGISTSKGYRFHGKSVRPVYGERVRVTGISLSTNSISLLSGQSSTLTTTFTPANAPEKGIFWTSSDNTVAMVDGAGNVTAVNSGTATITAKTVDGGYTAICEVTVQQPDPEAVDLGLSVKWASFNLGASVPELYGGYYQWADTQDVSDKHIFLYWSNCPYHTGIEYSAGWTKYIPSGMSSYWGCPGSPDNKTVLDPEDDVAHIKWGGKWRMPTREEFNELIDNCSSEQILLNGVYGRKFTSKKNGNSIFMPAAGYRYGNSFRGGDGYYWSSSLRTDIPESACCIGFNSNIVCTDYRDRCDGLNVRPVSE